MVVGKVASTLEVNITVTLGELPVVNNDGRKRRRGGEHARGRQQDRGSQHDNDVKDHREECRSRCCEALIRA